MYIFRFHNCWICSRPFESRTELNRHVTGKSHTRLAVICPWCLGKQKTFTRLNDLKQHVLSTHKATFQTLPSSFFTAGTGFFLALYPDDYRRIVQVAPYENEECFEARKAVLRWCSSQLNSTKVTQEWRRAWLPAKSIKKPCAQPVKRPVEEDLEWTDQRVDREWEDLGKDPHVFLEDAVVVKKSKPVKPLDYTSSEDPTTDREEPESPVSKEFVAEPTGERVTNRGDYVDKPAAEVIPPKAAPEEVTDTREVNLTDPETPATSLTGGSIPTNTMPDAVLSISTSSVPSSVQKRAEELLKFGQMPMFAPARRDWTKGGLLVLDVGDTNFTWPPLGWQDLDADRRLLSSEFAAMAIEFKRTGLFPTLSRGTLLDKYNFLVLPGSAKIRRSESESRQHKSRFYNYQELRRISLSSTSSKDDSDFVDFFERAKKGGFTDDIVRAIDVLRVPLRLE